LEDKWVAMRSDNYVVAFLLALSDVNTFLTMRYFVPLKWPQTNNLLSSVFLARSDGNV